MRRATAYKRQIGEPVDWQLRPNKQGVFHKIELDQAVMTPDGEMQKVCLRSVCDLQDPGTDVAILVGNIVEVLPSGVIKPQLPELWFWRDLFWTKAVDSQHGQEYYRNKHYLLYPVKVDREQELFKAIEVG